VDTRSTANSDRGTGWIAPVRKAALDPTNADDGGRSVTPGAVVLLHCLTGRYPCPDGTTVEKMLAQSDQGPTPIKNFGTRDVPDGLVGGAVAV